MKNLIFVVFILVSFSSCISADHQVSINGHFFTVELADNNYSREQGLMYRKSMDKDAGMLFIFPSQQPRSFWMKNTLIALDILYIDSQLKLVSMQTNVPPCRNTSSRCPSYPSYKPAKYVLEINAGRAKELEIKVGDKMQLLLK